MRSILLFICSGLVLVLATPPLAAEAALRPNIVWVVSEDNNPWLGCYGDPLARTPTLDALARTGVRYLNTHAPAPVCAPSRASIITGRYAPSLGTQHMRSFVPLPAGLRYFPSYLREAGYYCTNRAKTDYNAVTPPGTWDQNGAQAHWKNRAAGQPFFAVFNFNSSHESNLHQRRPLKTDPTKVRVPGYLPDTPDVRADIAQYHDCIATMDREIGATLAELAAAGEADTTIVFYFGDNGGVLPRSKRFLYDNGTRVPLIIHVPARWAHLAPGPAGSTNADLVTLLDLPATVLSLAGVAVPAEFDGRALAGPAQRPGPPHIFAFRDRMDEVYDLNRAVIGPRFRYLRNYRPDLPAGQRLDYLWQMASMRDWERLHREGRLNAAQSAFFEPRPAELLFDVIADPDCLTNLAGEPGHQAVLLAMRSTLRTHLLAHRDLGFMPESMVRARAGDRAPAILFAEESTYPLGEILDLLDRLQLPATPPAGLVQAALANPQPVIRYWAAMSAGQIRPLDETTRAALATAQHDPDPAVRLAAAVSTLTQSTGSTDAWSVIDAALQAARPGEERLTALHALTRLEKLPPNTLATLRTAPAPESTLMANYYRRTATALVERETAHTGVPPAASEPARPAKN